MLDVCNPGGIITHPKVVVFVADHGYHLGERGEWEKKAAFELTLRVPLLIAAPHLPSSHGKSTTGLVDLVDIYPTLTVRTVHFVNSKEDWWADSPPHAGRDVATHQCPLEVALWTLC